MNRSRYPSLPNLVSCDRANTRHPDAAHIVFLPNGKMEIIDNVPITIWDMALPQQRHDYYCDLGFDATNPPMPFDDRVEIVEVYLENQKVNSSARDREFGHPWRTAEVTLAEMLAMDYLPRMYGKWFPTECNQRDWPKMFFEQFRTFVLVCDEKPIGICHIVPGTTENEIKYIGLIEEAAGKGLGGYFERAMLVMLAQRPEKIVLGTTSFDFSPTGQSVDFHRHIGFEVTGETRTHVIDTPRFFATRKEAYRNAYAQQWGAVPKLHPATP